MKTVFSLPSSALGMQQYLLCKSSNENHWLHSRQSRTSYSLGTVIHFGSLVQILLVYSTHIHILLFFVCTTTGETYGLLDSVMIVLTNSLRMILGFVVLRLYRCNDRLFNFLKSNFSFCSRFHTCSHHSCFTDSDINSAFPRRTSVLS